MKITTNEILTIVKECVDHLLTESVKVDNFDKAANVIMNFRSPDDFYYVEIMKRKKDNRDFDFSRRGPDSTRKEIYLGSYAIHSPQELLEKKPEIVELCERENARAYISINARSMKDTMRFVEYCKMRGMFPGREFQHAAGQHKEYNDRDHKWEEERPRGKFDFDPTEEEAKIEFDKLLSKFNMEPLFVGQTPSGGWEYIMNNRDGKYLDLSGFEKYRPKEHTRRRSDPMVLFKGDAPMVLYSNVNN